MLCDVQQYVVGQYPAEMFHTGSGPALGRNGALKG
jgi:hypothetical protein